MTKSTDDINRDKPDHQNIFGQTIRNSESTGPFNTIDILKKKRLGSGSIDADYDKKKFWKVTQKYDYYNKSKMVLPANQIFEGR